MSVRGRIVGALPWVGLVGLFAVLHLWRLDACPNPNGDEGNWTWFAYDLSLGRPVALPPTARFVSMAFAWLIAGSYKLFGVSFASARATLALGLALAIGYALWASRRLGVPRLGYALALALTVHPWSVAWSRTVTVPYAWSLGLAVASMLAWALVAAERSALSIVVAVQLLALGFHASPLAVVPCVAASVYLLGEGRWVLRRRAFWASVFVGLVQVVPIVRDAIGVAGAGESRQRHFFNNLALRLYVYLRAVGGAFLGEPTLRHFTDRAWPFVGELLCWLIGVSALLWALRKPPSHEAHPLLRRLALAQTLAALLITPLLLAPARPWNLPAIDTDRYLWVFVGPFCMALALLVEAPSRVRRTLATALIVYLLVGATGRGVAYFAWGGSVDRGFYTLAGGGADRAWKMASTHETLPRLIIDRFDIARGGRPINVLMSDYTFHPLHFVAAPRQGFRVWDVTKFPLPAWRGELHGFVRWSDGLLAPGYFPPEVPTHRAELDALLFGADFLNPRRIAVVRQPNGAPLVELWLAERRP